MPARARSWSVARFTQLLELPVYPSLIITAFVAGHYAASPVTLSQVFRPLGAGLALVITLQLVTTVVLRRSQAAGLVIGVLTLLLVGLWPLAALLGWVMVARLWLKVRRRRLGQDDLMSLAVVSRRLNGLSLAWLLIGITGAVLSGALGLPRFASPTQPGSDLRGGPDIYVILLDAYARADTMRSHFGIDESSFLSALEERGFVTATHSQSNYSRTALTLVSMLYMRHALEIPELESPPPDYTGQYRLLTDALDRETPALALLRSHGYEVVAIPSRVSQMGVRDADRYLDAGYLDNFEFHLLGATPIGGLVQFVSRDFIYDQQRAAVQRVFQAVEEVASERSPRPKFIFAHVMMPHPPFVVGPLGEPKPLPACYPGCSLFNPPIEEDDWVSGYRDQVLYVNEVVINTIDRVLASSPDPPVIIVMSDHGSRGFPDDPREAVRNFWSALTPGHPDLFPDDVTPITLIPRLSKAYLSHPLPMPQDDVYFSPQREPFPLIPLGQGAPE